MSARGVDKIEYTSAGNNFVVASGVIFDVVAEYLRITFCEAMKNAYGAEYSLDNTGELWWAGDVDNVEDVGRLKC